MPKPRLTDPVLIYLLQELRKTNEQLPPEKRMGLDAYCKKYGILLPRDYEQIALHEVSLEAHNARREDNQ